MRQLKKTYSLLAAGALLAIGVLVTGCAAAQASAPPGVATTQTVATTRAPAAGSPRALHTLSGTIKSVSGQTLTITTPQHTSATIDLYPHTRVLTVESATLANIQPGATVRVVARLNGSASSSAGSSSSSTTGSSATPTAVRIVLTPAPQHPAANDHDADNAHPRIRHALQRARSETFAGTVQSVNAQTLTVKTWAGKTVTVALSSQTKYNRVVAGTTSAIAAGTQFRALGSYDSSGHFWAHVILLNETGQNVPGVSNS
jgi:hypothetical protein